MPSCMIHLQAARCLRPQGSALFFIGSAAPDAIQDWRTKDCTHLRNAPDRGIALAQLAGATDPHDDFAEGALFHLYTDWRWDVCQLARYWDGLGGKPQGSEWVPGYRREISHASAWIYHNSPWAPALWDTMLAVPPEQYGILPGMDCGDIRAYLEHNHEWHGKLIAPPSAHYPPEETAAFAEAAAESYRVWRGAETSLSKR